MAGEANITFVGNVGNDPEIKFLPSGDAQTTMSVAVTKRKKENNEWKDGDTTWYRVTAFGRKGELLADTLQKGARVVIVGRFEVGSYEKDGQTRFAPNVTLDEFGIVPKAAKSNRNTQTSNERNPW